DEDFKTARDAVSVVEAGGLGTLSVTDLGKALAGTSAREGFWLGENEEGLSGAGATDELETMAQLVYLGFTAPRKDPEAFAAWKLGVKASLDHRDVVPENVFSDALTRVMTG